jgi:hypothetical protein
MVRAAGPVRLVDIFDGKSQLIVYNHMCVQPMEPRIPVRLGQAWSTGMDREERRYAALVWLLLLIVVVPGPVPRLNPATVPPFGGESAGRTGDRYGGHGPGEGGRVQVGSTIDRHPTTRWRAGS